MCNIRTWLKDDIFIVPEINYYFFLLWLKQEQAFLTLINLLECSLKTKKVKFWQSNIKNVETTNWTESL